VHRSDIARGVKEIARADLIEQADRYRAVKKGDMTLIFLFMCELFMTI
jgi:hypothetical protein